ncbi:MAG: AAA family ATPase [Actinomycetota bacterium]|nr:AAA family ATPase [Actinomycetota bacterium]
MNKKEENKIENPLLKKENDPYLNKIIAIASQKGGVGKTTTAVNLTAFLSSFGYKTILIDFDPQSNATSAFSLIPEEINTTVYSLIIYNEDPNKAILETIYPNLKIIPSTRQLAGAEVEMVTVFKREFRLKDAIQRIEEQYDFIIIDCPPSLGLLTINALAACKDVIIPIQNSYFSLEGVAQLLNTIDLVKMSLNSKLEVKGVLFTMYSRSRLAEGIYNDLKNNFGNKLYNTIIPKNVRLDEASSHGKPVLYYDKNCKGSIAYKEFSMEVLNSYLDNKNFDSGLTI